MMANRMNTWPSALQSAEVVHGSISATTAIGKRGAFVKEHSTIARAFVFLLTPLMLLRG